MSRIGRMPIPIDSGVKVSIGKSTVEIEGPKGKMSHTLPRGIAARIEEQRVLVQRKDDSKSQRALHGLTRALLANSVHGVSKGFRKELEIHGVGYRAVMAGNTITFSLGFSHPVELEVPAGIEVKIEKNRLAVSGCNRQQVGQIAADIRALRPPDVYKLKGIRYADEQLRKKAGKTGAT